MNKSALLNRLPLLFSFLLLVATFSCGKQEVVSLTVVNLSSHPVDSVKVSLLFANDTSYFYDAIPPGHKRTLYPDASGQEIRPTVEGTNLFWYYIAGKKVFGFWGLVDGGYSHQVSTIYIFDKGWSRVRDSTQLCCSFF